MGWSQQSAMAVEYPHGSPRHPKQPPKIMAGDPFLDDLPSKPPCWGISPFAKHPNYCRSACTRRQKTQGTRKRQDLRSCNQLLVAGQINCYQLLSNIQWISNEYPMNIQWISNDHHCFLALIHMIHSHFAKYDDFLDPTNHLSGWEVATTYAWRVESKCISAHCVYIVYLYICRCIYVYLVHSKSQ